MNDRHTRIGPPVAKHGRFILAADLDDVDVPDWLERLTAARATGDHDVFARVYAEVHADYQTRMQARTPAA